MKTIPKGGKNGKYENWLSEEVLQIVVKGIKVKIKGEKERYTHLKAEFQIIARRNKKAFLSDQCKEIEENNRMGKTRGLFKNIRNESPVQVRCTTLDAWGWHTGTTQRDGTGREEGGGFSMGNTCIPVADSC